MERRLASKTSNKVTVSTHQQRVGKAGRDSRFSLRYVQVTRWH